MGGSSKPAKKRESGGERNARILAAKKSGQDLASIRESASRIRNARKRPNVFGGSETGMLGGAATTLGVQGV